MKIRNSNKLGKNFGFAKEQFTYETKNNYATHTQTHTNTHKHTQTHTHTHTHTQLNSCEKQNRFQQNSIE